MFFTAGEPWSVWKRAPKPALAARGALHSLSFSPLSVSGRLRLNLDARVAESTLFAADIRRPYAERLLADTLRMRMRSRFFLCRSKKLRFFIGPLPKCQFNVKLIVQNRDAL